ncbi:hypothetical protein [Actinomadura formosensis]|uniref:hypothetical protein n=1 Tax=Actinomadura formosensis TaxID=60706 RepID=UPI00082BE88A|nr:hypothetical protein [Actinomadura formosensis]
MIPIYTTDGVPIANAGPVERAWPVWTDEAEIGHGLDRLAYQAAQQGAHAIVALKITAYWVPAGDTYLMPGRTVQDLIPRARHVLFGTAVLLGAPEPSPHHVPASGEDSPGLGPVA